MYLIGGLEIMRWSKLKKLVESRFALQIQNRIAIHITSYANSQFWGRAWFTFDGKELVNFCEDDHWRPFKYGIKTYDLGIPEKKLVSLITLLSNMEK